jgi:predicted phage baseplate assembly protein
LKELGIIFGRKNLSAIGLTLPNGKHKPQTSDEQRAALERLLANDERLLAKKLRRTEVLRRRAQAGYVLTQTESLELAEMFGQESLADLGLSDARSLGPATFALQQEPRRCLPAVVVRKERPATATPAPTANNRIAQDNFYPRWLPQPNLLASTARDRHFVAEIDDDHRAHLRFGDGELGMAPTPATTLRARYRVGNGRAGNVGAEAISHMVLRKTKIEGVRIRVRNPLPAEGGTEPEPLDEVKLFAPGSFRHELERAITEDDYARLSERGRTTSVQRAASALGWSGSWQEMRVAIDPVGTDEASAGLLEEIEGTLYRYQRIGHDLAVLPAAYVPLDIRIIICVEPHYLRGHVKAALLDIFSDRDLDGGRRGLFHPDNLTFGQSIYLSQLVAAAAGVEGVESVKVEKLERLFEGSRQEIQNGLLPVGPLEVARLDNDRSFPERGQMVLDVRGGR